MHSLYPLLFEPILQERVWGGNRLAKLFGRPVPENRPIGESWEISDRPDAESRIRNGPLQGQTLRWLMQEAGEQLMGRPIQTGERFPWLGKLLDARDDLSLQVHPPAHLAAALGGEPKTEMWYVAWAAPGARLYAGLKVGVDQPTFVQALDAGTVAECFHQLPVQAGDVLFLPSGRVHALGKGIVIFEIQQNSDTTYRVFDWNRVGLDGRPRPLHREAALVSIDFEDHTPRLVPRHFAHHEGEQVRALVRDPLFWIDHVRADGLEFRNGLDLRPDQTAGLFVGLAGEFVLTKDDGFETKVTAGSFCLVPASVNTVQVRASTQAEWLRVTYPPAF